MMELKEEEEKQKEYRKNLKRKRKADPEPEEMVGDPDMMAMMGFSGFGTSSKNLMPAKNLDDTLTLEQWRPTLIAMSLFRQLSLTLQVARCISWKSADIFA